ncbi:MAG: hypothetical protein ABIR29_14110 [Chthoniobacterales bacterium]
MTKFQRGAVWVLFLLFVLLAAGALFARVGAGWYLGSERFRHQITRAVEEELKAKGSFQPLHFNDGTFYSDGFSAQGQGRAFFSDLRADQIRAVVNWRGLLDHRWEIDELNIQNLEIRFAGRAPAEATPGASAAKPLPPKPSSPWKLDLRQAEIAQSSWHWGKTPETTGSLTKSAFTLTPSNGSWLVEAQSGTLNQSGWPALTIESAKLRYTGASLFVTESALRAGDGRINVDGEIEFDRAADLQVRLDKVDFSPFLPPDWRLRLHGKIAGTAKIHAPLPEGALRVEGDLQLVDGHLEALPVLDQIATFTRTDRFRRVALTRGSLTFTNESDRTVVTNLVLESEGLMRVEGGCTIAQNKINGVFQIGVTSASLQWLPGSQARVFTVAHDGYFWTPVRVSGPIDHPHEDLTKRLIAAAANELLENSRGNLEDAAKALLELIPH